MRQVTKMGNDFSEYQKAARRLMVPYSSYSPAVANSHKTAYKNYIEWCLGKNLTEVDEDALVMYFKEMELTRKWKYSTIWVRYKMIRKQLVLRHKVNISQYLKLRSFLQERNKAFSSKKSKYLSKEHFETFVSQAPDVQYLAVKVILIAYFCLCILT